MKNYSFVEKNREYNANQNVLYIFRVIAKLLNFNPCLFIFKSLQ